MPFLQNLRNTLGRKDILQFSRQLRYPTPFHFLNDKHVSIAWLHELTFNEICRELIKVVNS